MFNDVYEVPFYVIIKIEFGMIFGWLTLKSGLEFILDSKSDDYTQIER